MLLTMAGGCPFQGLVYDDDLVGGYAVWATDVLEEASIVLKRADGRGGVSVVPAMVFAYGYNDQFIIAKRRPAEYGRIKDTTIQWYIIGVQSKRVHGPLTEDEFQRLRNALRVPGNLSFTTEVNRHSGQSPF